MKTTMKTLACAFLIFISFTACKKTTELTTDRVPPKITFTIKGGQENNTFEANGTGMSPSGEYIFRENTKYTMTVVLSDTSGLGYLRYRTSKNAQVKLFTINGAPSVTEIPSTTENEYTIITERTNPYTSYLITSTFTTGVQGEATDIRFAIDGRDYLPNISSLTINGAVWANPPLGVFGWNEF